MRPLLGEYDMMLRGSCLSYSIDRGRRGDDVKMSRQRGPSESGTSGYQMDRRRSPDKSGEFRLDLSG